MLFELGIHEHCSRCVALWRVGATTLLRAIEELIHYNLVFLAHLASLPTRPLYWRKEAKVSLASLK